jgi:hypothetical protein
MIVRPSLAPLGPQPAARGMLRRDELAAARYWAAGVFLPPRPGHNSNFMGGMCCLDRAPLPNEFWLNWPC